MGLNISVWLVVMLYITTHTLVFIRIITLIRLPNMVFIVILSLLIGSLPGCQLFHCLSLLVEPHINATPRRPFSILFYIGWWSLAVITSLFSSSFETIIAFIFIILLVFSSPPLSRHVIESFSIYCLYCLFFRGEMRRYKRQREAC